MPIYTGPYANSGIPNALKAVGRRATVLREWQVFSRTRFQIVQLVASRFREDCAWTLRKLSKAAPGF